MRVQYNLWCAQYFLKVHQANRHGGVVPDVSECGALDIGDGLEDGEEAGAAGSAAALLGDLPSQVLAQTGFRSSSANALSGTGTGIGNGTTSSGTLGSLGSAAGAGAGAGAREVGEAPSSPGAVGGGGPSGDVGGRVAGVELDEALRAELKSLTHNLPSNVVVTRAAQPKATSRVLCDICLKEVCNKVHTRHSYNHVIISYAYKL